MCPPRGKRRAWSRPRNGRSAPGAGTSPPLRAKASSPGCGRCCHTATRLQGTTTYSIFFGTISTHFSAGAAGDGIADLVLVSTRCARASAVAADARGGGAGGAAIVRAATRRLLRTAHDMDIVVPYVHESKKSCMSHAAYNMLTRSTYFGRVGCDRAVTML